MILPTNSGHVIKRLLLGNGSLTGIERKNRLLPMNFYTAIKTVLSRYAQFSGRATRFSPDAGQPLRLLTNLGLLLPSLAVAVRRLHDINRSGWWWLVALVPVIGALFLLWWHMQPGGDGENRFG